MEKIYGLRAIIEAIKAGRYIDHVLVKREKGKSDVLKELLKLSDQNDIPVKQVPLEKLDRETKANHQGAIAIISPITYYKIEDIIPYLFEEGQSPFVLILDGITDVRNFGSIARTASCAGVDTIVIPTHNSVSVTADAIKTSAGALNSMPVCRTNSILNTAKYLKESGVTLIAATEKSEDLFYNVKYDGPVAIILGAEDKGISTEMLAISDYKVKIPIMNQIQSLNVSNAASIVMYEVVKQRISK